MLIPILFILLIDIYAFQAVHTVFNSGPFFKNTAAIIYWVISLIIYVVIFVGIMTYFDLTPIMKRLILGAVICVGIAKVTMVAFVLTDDILRVFRLIAKLFTPKPTESSGGLSISRLEFLNRAALVAGGTAFGLFAWGMIRTAYNYTIRRERVALDGLTDEFKGLKIVQISDLHLGSFTSSRPIEKAVRMINELDADLVFFTGDLVNSSAEEAEPYIDALSKIKAKLGVYSSLGNHDYASYYRRLTQEEADADMARLIAIHGECGWTILNNENRIIDVDGNKIAIIGVENWGYSRHFPKAGNLDIAKLGTENANARLLLSHDPSHWNHVISEDHDDIDITFSGHTHGFQIGIESPRFNIKWSPGQYAYPQWAGLYKQAKQHLYVNRGLGFIGYHGRVGILPEITLMEVVKA